MSKRSNVAGDGHGRRGVSRARPSRRDGPMSPLRHRRRARSSAAAARRRSGCRAASIEPGELARLLDRRREAAQVAVGRLEALGRGRLVERGAERVHLALEGEQRVGELVGEHREEAIARARRAARCGLAIARLEPLARAVVGRAAGGAASRGGRGCRRSARPRPARRTGSRTPRRARGRAGACAARPARASGRASLGVEAAQRHEGPAGEPLVEQRLVAQHERPQLVGARAPTPRPWRAARRSRRRARDRRGPP